MNARVPYSPGPAAGVQIEKIDGPDWKLVIVRQLRHAPEKVWAALVDPEQLREWAPFDADRSLATEGATVKLTTYEAPIPPAETVITKADAPKELIYDWGGNPMRWLLEPYAGGTRLTLWTSIDRRYIAMGAAGWHLCFDVLDHLLAGEPLGRMVGMEVMKFDGFQRLLKEYAAQFKLEPPKW